MKMQSQQSFIDSTEIQGTLNRIRFKNDNGFLIGLFENDDYEMAALGNLLDPKIGFDYKLCGKWVVDTKWGKQFKFQSYTTIQPKSTDGIYRYLVNTAKWVGPVIGERLIKEFGTKTIDVIRTDPKGVAKAIRGLSLKRTKEMQQIIIENEENEELIVKLEALIGGMGFRKSLPIEVAKKWASDAVTVITKNPYQLMTIRGIGFLSADRLAITRFGIEHTSIYRQKAGIAHILEENERSGNVWCYIDDLFRKAETLLGCDIQNGYKAILKEDIIKHNQLVANEEIAIDEQYIATKIRSLMNA